MRPSILCATLLAAFSLRAAEPRRIVFDGASPEQKFALRDLGADLPADWSSYGFLVLEFRSSTSQRFELKVYNQGSARRVRIQPFQGAWIRAAVPLKYFLRQDREGTDLASLANKPRAAYFLNIGGPYGPLNAVDAVGFAMQTPLGKPALELRSVALAKDSPGDALLGPKPLVDEFGQWIPAEWPGKAKTLADLKAAWASAPEASATAAAT